MNGGLESRGVNGGAMLNRLICWLLGHRWQSINHRPIEFTVSDDFRTVGFANCDFKCTRCGRVR